MKGFNLFVRRVVRLPLQGRLLPQNSDGLVDLADLFEQVVGAVLLIAEILYLTGALRADLKRNRRVVERRAQWSRNRLHLGDAGCVEDSLGHPLQQDHVGWIAQIVIRLDHQEFGIEPGLREVPLGGGVADVGWCTVGHVVADVVTGLVAGQRQQTHRGHRQCCDENRPGPTHDRRADPTPSPCARLAFRLQQSEAAANGHHGRREGERCHQCHEDADRGGNAEALKIRQSGEAQAQDRARDRETRPQNDVGGPAVHVVVSGFAIESPAPIFVVAAQEEDRVVGAGRYHQQREDIGRVGRQPDDAGVTKEGHNATGCGHFDEDGDKHQQHRDE